MRVPSLAQPGQAGRGSAHRPCLYPVGAQARVLCHLPSPRSIASSLMGVCLRSQAAP